MKIGLVIVAAVVVPSMAVAAPVNLRCVLNDTSGPNPMDLTLNEDEGTATFHWIKSDTTVKKPAAFTPNAVQFFGFTIDRTTLGIERDNSFMSADAATTPPPTKGQCSIVQIKRAF